MRCPCLHIVDQVGSPAQQAGDAQGRFAKMLASSATAAVCAGPDNIIVSWNSAAEELFGHTAEQALGQPISIIIPERLRDAHSAGLLRATRSGHARLAGSCVEVLALHADGSELAVDLSLSMWTDDGQPMFGALLRDITDRQLARRRLEHLAHCDTLTALPNRNALEEQLARRIASAPLSLLRLDLDGFRFINETVGYAMGDELLKAVAGRLSAVAPQAYIARLGGDEFALIPPEPADLLASDKLAKAVLAALEEPFEVAGQHLHIGTSIGIATAPVDAAGVEQLLSCADLALHQAKGAGGGVRVLFTRAMQVQADQRNRIVRELRGALERDEFRLHFQPQVSLATGEVRGFEALLRWQHPDHGLLLPSAFMTELEASPVAEEVGDWILRQACQAAVDFAHAGLGQVRMGVNLFAAQLRSGRLCRVVKAALDRSGIAPQQLELEITETTVLRHNAQSTSALRKLKALGVGVAFDDFGTGFASLSLLQKYPLTRLKIDQSFVRDITLGTGDAAIVQAVVGMARNLGLEVIAEGVENPEQEQALRQLGCDEGQGYRYGKPLGPAATVAALNGLCRVARRRA